ncbi:hypothetical protein [Streptomyces sp. NPDC050164]|uniref:hypothetical protein n=1 Tax=Streptomyces sp. NPDC050164 TaxID=3365605 RepID=UPI003792CE61
MKSLKAAALVVGSLVVAGAAAPAVALDAPKVKAAGLTGEVTKVTEHVDQRLAGHQMEVLDTENKGFLPSTVKEAKNALEQESARLAPGLHAQS